MKYLHGDIRDITEGVIVHGVNCQGVMNSGVAKALRDKYPQVFDSYRAYMDKYAAFGYQPEAFLGTCDFVKINEGLWVVNAFTQLDYGRDGKRYVSYEALAQVFEQIRDHECSQGRNVYFPKIGAGLGGGNWKIIGTIIDETLVRATFPKADTWNICVVPT